MNIQSLLNYSNKKLKQNLINSAMLDSEILLQKVIKKDRKFLILNPEKNIKLDTSGNNIKKHNFIKKLYYNDKHIYIISTLNEYGNIQVNINNDFIEKIKCSSTNDAGDDTGVDTGVTSNTGTSEISIQNIINFPNILDHPFSNFL